jgi:hypothetical protein
VGIINAKDVGVLVDPIHQKLILGELLIPAVHGVNTTQITQEFNHKRFTGSA